MSDSRTTPGWRSAILAMVEFTREGAKRWQGTSSDSRRSRLAGMTAGWLLVLAVALAGTAASACPFCAAVSQTIDEELQSMQVAVFATLIQAAELNDDDRGDAALPLSRFRVVEILKGQPNLKVGDEIQVAYFGPPDDSYTFLIMSPEEQTLTWGNPLLLNDISANYVRQLRSLPTGFQRLVFFLDYLEHDDELLARDAYDEFAKAPYEEVIAIKDKMNREKLIEWIRDQDVSVEHRRLYLTMLGVCGQPQDADLLEEMIRSSDPIQRAGLNALIAAYLTLKGSAGLPVVEELFLTNDEVGYADVHAAIMAIRFHGNETDVIPRADLLKSMRLILDRPEIADLVIPDLARWEDWTVLPEVIELFRKADSASNWVRVPVVNYVRACPLPEAQVAMAKLEKIDPEAVRRASALFPFANDTKEVATENGDQDADVSAEDEESLADVPSMANRPDPFSNQQPIRIDGDSNAPSRMAPLTGVRGLIHSMPAWGIWLVSCIALLFGALMIRRVTMKAH